MKNSTDRKDQIWDASLKILDANGVQGLTTARIAKEVGFSEAALYKHFKSKQEIIGFSLDKMLDLIKSTKSEVENESGNSEEKLFSFFQKHLSALNERPGLYRLLYSDELHLSSRKLMKKMSKTGKEFLNTVEYYLKKAKKEGLINNVDTAQIALSMMGCVQGSFTAQAVLDKKESIDEMGMKMIRSIMDGISARN